MSNIYGEQWTAEAMKLSYKSPSFAFYREAIDNLMEAVHDNAVKHGFWEEYRKADDYWRTIFISNQLSLVHSEISEMLEALRHKDAKNFAEEAADVFIRMFDLCKALDVNVTDEIFKKHIANMDRPIKHGKIM